MELNDSRNVSMDYEKASSLSSDESTQIGMAASNATTQQQSAAMNEKLKHPLKYRGPTPNTLLIQPFVHLGQSLPNLNLNLNTTQPTSNTLLVPGTSAGQSNTLLSPTHRGISYPPLSPTR